MPDTLGHQRPDVWQVVRDHPVSDAMSTLRAELDCARRAIDELRKRLDANESARQAMQIRAERSEAQLNDAITAGRIARGEAAILRAEIVIRGQWGLRRRLCWALSRKR